MIFFSRDVLTEENSIAHIFYDYRWPRACTVRKGCASFLMVGLAVYDYGMFFFAQFFCTIPNFFYERTSRIILLDVHAFFDEALFNLRGSSKCRNNNDVIFPHLIPRNELRSIRVHDEFYPPALKICVYLLVVDHLAQE